MSRKYSLRMWTSFVQFMTQYGDKMKWTQYRDGKKGWQLLKKKSIPLKELGPILTTHTERNDVRIAVMSDPFVIQRQRFSYTAYNIEWSWNTMLMKRL